MMRSKIFVEIVRTKEGDSGDADKIASLGSRLHALLLDKPSSKNAQQTQPL